MSISSSILKPLKGRTGFLTGASGFVGTTTACRLILDCHVETLHVLCRGGSKRLWDIWSANLPEDIVSRLRRSDAVVVHDGNIEHINMGLPDSSIQMLQSNLNFIIHCASPSNLRARLAKLMPSVVDASLAIGGFALTCPHLKHFVYMSTAFANSHLHSPQAANTAAIKECVYPLNDLHPLESADEEYLEALKLGTVPELEDFPFAYGYAKNLTERLLINLYKDESEKLLIIRPSLIGPAESFPFAGFETPGSSPLTMCASALMMEPSMRVTLSSPLDKADVQSYFDEVPVDIVVNRLVVAMAQSYSGIFHAVAGERRFNSGLVWNAVKKERRLFWTPKVQLSNVDWRSTSSPRNSKCPVIIGTSFVFEECRTRGMWAFMNADDRRLMPLFAKRTEVDLHLRRRAIRRNVEELLEKKKWPVWLSNVVCRRVPVLA